MKTEFWIPALSFLAVSSAFAQLTVEVHANQKIFSKPGQFVLINVRNTSSQTITQMNLRAVILVGNGNTTALDALGGGDPLSTIPNAPPTEFSGHGTSYTCTIGTLQAVGTLKTTSGTQLVDGLIGILQVDGTSAGQTITVSPSVPPAKTNFVNGTTIITPAIVANDVTVLDCHTPFADADGDGDVDQDDFAMVQRCMTDNLLPADYATCGCFDHPMPGLPSGDNKIDAYDAVAFLACMSGPTVTDDPNCENAVIPPQASTIATASEPPLESNLYDALADRSESATGESIVGWRASSSSITTTLAALGPGQRWRAELGSPLRSSTLPGWVH